MFSITKMKAIWELFQQGKEIADKNKWTTHQVSATMLAGVLLAVVQLAKAYNYELPIDSDTATAIAGGVLTVVNTVMSIMGNKHLGLPSPQQGRETQQAVPSVQQEPVAEPTESLMQLVNQPVVEQPSIDADTEARAREWAAEHRKFSNDQNPNYFAG